MLCFEVISFSISSLICKESGFNKSLIFAFAIIVAIGAIMTYLGFDLTDSSNIPELESYFSLPLMLVLIAFQPIGEEIFFRGF